ncbi:MAG: DUF5666 domain-containing protein [Candidatus Omnitrophica bacterium]|jgi:hypothetical protein|nr:DUF5666 domain-containing protein [Candidatus Omnitrophota bacterium]
MGKTLIVFCIMITVGICATGVICAWEQTDDPDLRVFEGKITAVDVSNSTITVNGGIEMKFQISQDTDLEKSTYDIKLSDINVGDYVTVEYYRSGSESRVPEKVVRVMVESWE